MDDLVIAFAMRCDEQGLSYEAGLELAEQIAEELNDAAESRTYADRKDR